MRIDNVFRRKANRLQVWIDEYGFVPTAQREDDVPVFETSEPKKIGDDAIIFVEGQRRKVRLLSSHGMRGMARVSLWLVDMGPAK